MIELLTFVLIIAVTGYTMTLMMTPGEILDVIPALIYRLTKSTGALKLFQCEKCMAGQLALWCYLIGWWSVYNVREHFLVVIFSIFTAHVIGKILPQAD